MYFINDYDAFLCFHSTAVGFNKPPNITAGEIFFVEKAGDFIMADTDISRFLYSSSDGKGGSGNEMRCK
jgi:hypothetical protein